MTIVDVGANVGEWTSGALEFFPDATIHAFEPSVQAASKFREKNITALASGRVHLHPFALGSVISEAKLFFDSPASGIASLFKRRLDHFGIEMSQTEPIQVITLDNWAQGKEFNRPLALKIDVEGSELEVLRGASNFLNVVDVLQFEFGGTMIDSRTFFQDFWYFLRPKGYDIFRVTPLGLKRVKSYTESDEIFSYTNYFAVKR